MFGDSISSFKYIKFHVSIVNDSRVMTILFAKDLTRHLEIENTLV